MKSVTCSDIVRVADSNPHSDSDPGRPRSKFAAYASHYLPGLAPALASIHVPGIPRTQGRLCVTTRFQACHLAGTLDDALDKLGYVSAERAPGTLRYRPRGSDRPRRWPTRPRADIAVTVGDHALEVTGPFIALRALRGQLAR